MRRRAALAVAAAAVVLASCGSSPATLDQAATEAAVGDAVAAALEPDGAAVAAAGIASGTALSRIGTITEQRQVLRCLDASGHLLKLDQQGYDHFG